MDSGNGVTLSELIESTAEELRRVRKRARDRASAAQSAADLAGDAPTRASGAASDREVRTSDPVMEFTGCELELAVTVKAEGKAGIKFYIISAGASLSGETVSRVKLTFGAPKGAGGVVLRGEVAPKERIPIPDPKRAVNAASRGGQRRQR